MTSGFCVQEHTQNHPFPQSPSTPLPGALCLPCICARYLCLGIWGPLVCVSLRLFVRMSVDLSLCTPAGHGGVWFWGFFLMGPQCHASKRGLGRALAVFRNQNTSGLERALKCLGWSTPFGNGGIREHFLKGQRSCGEEAQRGGRSGILPATQQPPVARACEAFRTEEPTLRRAVSHTPRLQRFDMGNKNVKWHSEFYTE